MALTNTLLATLTDATKKISINPQITPIIVPSVVILIVESEFEFAFFSFKIIIVEPRTHIIIP